MGGGSTEGRYWGGGADNRGAVLGGGGDDCNSNTVQMLLTTITISEYYKGVVTPHNHMWGQVHLY